MNSSSVEIPRLVRAGGPSATIVSAAYFLGADSVHSWCLERLWCVDLSYGVTLSDVEVSQITHTQRFPFKVRGPNAIVGVAGGKWDRMAVRITETDLFRSLSMRFDQGTSWEETPCFQRAKHRINRGKCGWDRCTTIKELYDRLGEIEQLYRDMAENGYRGDRENSESRLIRGITVPDEIRIAIARDGTVIRCASAKHRLLIAKLLGIERIPAVIQLVHRDADLNQFEHSDY